MPRPSGWAAGLVTGGIGLAIYAIIKVNDWGWRSPAFLGCALLSMLLIALFVRHCLRAAHPFIDPRLFRIRSFTGSVLTTAPFSVSFGGMLLSIAMFEQDVWGFSALLTGLTIAPGPLMVPLTSLLVAGRLIRRFGPAAVVTAGLFCFAAGLACWAALLGGEPDLPVVVGAGATGGYFGGRLAEAGRDVAFLLRPARAAALRADGLRIISPKGDAAIQPRIVEAGTIDGAYDAILLTVKSFSLDQAMEDLAPAVGPGTMILPVLNGIVRNLPPPGRIGHDMDMRVTDGHDDRSPDLVVGHGNPRRSLSPGLRGFFFGPFRAWPGIDRLSPRQSFSKLRKTVERCPCAASWS